MRAVFFVGLTVALVSAAPAPAGKAAREDGTKVVGTWKGVGGEKAGMKEPEERVKGTTVRFAKDTITVTDSKDKQTYGAEYKLDTSKKPWKISMTATSGPPK